MLLTGTCVFTLGCISTHTHVCPDLDQGCNIWGLLWDLCSLGLNGLLWYSVVYIVCLVYVVFLYICAGMETCSVVHTFISSPCEKVLQRCRKADLYEVAVYYGLVVSHTLTKQALYDAVCNALMCVGERVCW